MNKITDISLNFVKEIQRDIYDSYISKNNLQEALQETITIIYRKLRDSIVLGRIFHLLQFQNLPTFDKDFVESFAKKVGVSENLTDETNVLCLMGTKGEEPEWNDRTLSRGHLGIPLVSAEFLAEIPMMASLLNSIGVNIPNVVDFGKVEVKSPFSNQGFFIVENAKEAVDAQNRQVIADQYFVEEYGIQSVLGFGSQHILYDTFTVAVFFLRDGVIKGDFRIETFSNLLNLAFKKVANHFLDKGEVL